MKVKKNTDHTLIVEEVPWLFAIFFLMFILVFSGVGIALLLDGELAGLAFLGFGAIIAPFMLYLFVRRVQVVFYRPEGWVEIRRANLIRRSSTRYDIAEIRRANVQSTRSSKGNTLRRITLVVEKGGVEGEKPLTLDYSNVGRSPAIAEAINAWLGVAASD